MVVKTRTRRFALVVVMALLASLAVVTSAAHSARADSWAGFAEITNSQSGRCLGIAGDGNAGIWDCTGGNDQEWRQGLQYQDNGALADDYEILNKNGQCLDIAGGSTTQGAQVVADGCVGSPTQGWRMPGAGQVQIENVGTGEELAVHSGSATNGSLVIQWANPGPDGKWNLPPTAGFLPWNGYVRIANPNSGRCLGIAADGNAGIWDCTHNKDQEWETSAEYRDPDGTWLAYYMLSNENLQCLSVAGNSGTQGAQVVVQPCTGSNSEGWFFHYDSTHNRFVFENLGSHLILAVKSGATGNGSAVVQWNNTGGADQAWGTSA